MTQQFDIIYLQETHIYQKKHIGIINNEWQGQHYRAYGSYHSAGVGILFASKFPGKINESHIRSDYEGCALYVPIIAEDMDIQLINVYAPNLLSECRKSFDKLSEYTKGLTPIIMGGDWNRVENTLLDKFGEDWVSDTSALASPQELLSNNNTVDIFHKLHPNNRMVTWYNPGETIRCRLDHFYVTPDIMSTTTQASISHFLYSDHNCVLSRFWAPPTIGLGLGYWKLNTSILADPALSP